MHYWGEPANGTWTLDAYRSPSVGLTTNAKADTAGIIKKWKLLLERLNVRSPHPKRFCSLRSSPSLFPLI